MFGYKFVCVFLLVFILCQLAWSYTTFKSKKVTTQYGNAVYIHHIYLPTITEKIIKDYGEVKTLRIERANVSKINDGAFSRLTSLRNLSLRGNQLTEINHRTFKFSTTPSLEDLDLSTNLIKTIDKYAFEQLKNLKKINLANNNLKVYNDNWFKYSLSLRYIDVSNNVIESLPWHILGNFGEESRTNVTFIASHNRLNSIHSFAFHGISDFNKLWLDHNLLRDVPANDFRYLWVKDIQLDHNMISCLHTEVKGVQKYNVSANPWRKFCLKDFMENMRNH